MSGPLRLLPGTGDTAQEHAARRRFPAGWPDNTTDGHAGHAGPHTPDSLPTLTPRPLRRRRPSWAEDPFDELAERLADVCGAAVHPDEIAAVLESDGLTQEQITGRYGRRDLFEVAEELYERVPRRFPDPEPPPDPWQASPWRCVLRGAVFGLPGLAYVLGAGLLASGTGAIAGLAASALVAWAWNQGLAHRAYVRLASGGRRAAARSLRVGAPVGALGAMAAGLLLSGPGTMAAFAAGQALYLAAGTVLLVLGRERDLLLALAPTVAGAASLLLWDPGPLAVTALLLVTVAAAVLLAAREIVRSGRTESTAGPGNGPPVTASLPYALFGLAAGALTLMAASADGTAVVVLTLSMGVAEWLLYRYRSLGLAALRHSTTPRGFQLRAGRALLLCLAGYLAVLAAPTLIRGVSPGPLLALGAVLWTALLLQAFGTAWPPAAICLAAALGAALGPAAVRPLVCGCAAAALVLISYALLGRATAHR
ncbi:hypothetical protein [Streptomyces sp. NBC_00620]|uniref:hypothetical protein n=1 Tax=Streptomyces sp. NBC_00620 TaxID=2903666 RepID=UPI002253B900|nr:hypothetical protein [Streptomyces sp. NBC_00620]MCX4975020.1 hypothetical protein [Streptomyces sp. NBC_00620]